MTWDQLKNLKARLYADSSLSGKTNDEVAAILSDPIVTPITPKTYTDKMLVRDLDTVTALTLLGTIDQIASTPGPQAKMFSLIKQWLGDGTGIDLGLQKTRDMIDSFVAASLLTLDQGSAVKALAETRGYTQGGPCSATEVALALASNAADALAESLMNQLSDKVRVANQRLSDFRDAVADGQTLTAPMMADLLVT